MIKIKNISLLHRAKQISDRVIPECFYRGSMFLLLGIIFIGCHSKPKENTACYKTQCYAIELAISDEEKFKGLQNREVLAKNNGMLFALDGQTPKKFWMKETLIPLDMLWLDYTGQIIYIEHDAVPCEKDPCRTYGPDVPASYVLEINAGEASRLDIHVGERIDIYISQHTNSIVSFWHKK